MSKLVDCPSCGGLLPAGRRCCPHCHCHYSPWRRLILLASAALGLGGCPSTTTVAHYGGPPVFYSDGGVDAAVPDLAVRDLGGEPSDGGP